MEHILLDRVIFAEGAPVDSASGVVDELSLGVEQETAFHCWKCPERNLVDRVIWGGSSDSRLSFCQGCE